MRQNRGEVLCHKYSLARVATSVPRVESDFYFLGVCRVSEITHLSFFLLRSTPIRKLARAGLLFNWGLCFFVCVLMFFQLIYFGCRGENS